MSTLQRLRLTKRQLLARLPEEGAPGTTSYRRAGDAPDLSACAADEVARDELTAAAIASTTGSVLICDDAGAMLVAPPFAVDERIDYSEAYPRALIALLERQRSYAVFLLRLGGFSVGFFRGETLAASKTDQRFVKNRHRKGGQSQRRFERIREKQIDELFAKACATARETLEPHDGEIEHVFLGGDRHTIGAFRKECDYFERFGERLMPRVLHVPGDPRHASLEAIPREVWSSDVWAVSVVEEPI